jgi:hypothetical protein
MKPINQNLEEKNARRMRLQSRRKIKIIDGATLLAFVRRSNVCGGHPSLNSSGDGHVVEHLERLV